MQPSIGVAHDVTFFLALRSRPCVVYLVLLDALANCVVVLTRALFRERHLLIFSNIRYGARAGVSDGCE